MRKKLDVWILAPVIFLIVFGLFNIFGINQKIFLVQLVHYALGIISMFGAYRMGLRFFRLNGAILYIVGIIILIGGFFISEEIRGSRRWIDLYFFQFQTSEFLKIIFIIFCAQILSGKTRRKFIVSFITCMIPFFFILKQPDLGSAIIYIAVYTGLLFLSGASSKYFLWAGGVVFAGLPLVWHALAQYQKNRIISFFDPARDPQGISYNLIQSVITVGSGRFFGRGLGLGTQSRFAFLPENTTDFAYASLVEQFGFVGGVTVIVLYMIIIARILKKAISYPLFGFEFLFLSGVACLLSTQIFVNIGMNMGLVPVTGITLPLISYGGSSIISTLILVGFSLAL